MRLAQAPTPLTLHFFHHPAQAATSWALAASGYKPTSRRRLLSGSSSTGFSHFARQRSLACGIATTAQRLFSHSSANMTATKIDGVAIAKKIREELKTRIEKQQETNPEFKPSLTIVQGTYVRMKLKAAQEVNIICSIARYPKSITESELLGHIAKLNNEPSIHGVLVQLPMPSHISEYAITSAVADEKDVDGFGVANIGELAKRRGRPRFVPCTPKGIMVLLRESKVELSGKNAVVVGRSDTVGSPVSYLLRNADATVTVCHRGTVGLEGFLKRADIVVVAIGQPNFIKGEWLSPGAVVIDVGTNYILDKSKKSGQRLVGDVDFDSAVGIVSKITPVPGGVGPMTVAMLLQNVVDAATDYFERK